MLAQPMRTIWKFPLLLQDHQTVKMPQFAKIISAQFQKGVLCLWALVDDEAPLEPRQIVICPTGGTRPDQYVNHIGTVQMANGDLVWHIFELIP